MTRLTVSGGRECFFLVDATEVETFAGAARFLGSEEEGRGKPLGLSGVLISLSTC